MLCLLQMVSCSSNPNGKQAPAIASNSAGETEFDIANLSGFYVILEFWASWCGPCRKELPKLIAAYPTMEEKNIEVVSIAIEKKKSNGIALSKEFNFPWRHQFVRESRYVRFDNMAKAYGVTEIPSSILIDPAGQVIGSYQSFEEAIIEIESRQSRQ